MDTEQMKHHLISEGERMIELGNKLAKSGDPLTDQERSVLRRGLAGVLEEMQWEQYIAFMRGDESYLKDISKRIHSLVVPPRNKI